MIKVTRLKPQRLFIPRADRTGTGGMAAGAAGAGYDVIEVRRGTAATRPLCQVWNYGDPAMPVAPADLPKDAAAILSIPPSTPTAATPASYVFCLQVR